MILTNQNQPMKYSGGWIGVQLYPGDFRAAAIARWKTFTARLPSRAGSGGGGCCRFSGPAYMVSVGYMDPGNWATDLAGGARFGYRSSGCS
jgi:hypothetical protein